MALVNSKALRHFTVSFEPIRKKIRAIEGQSFWELALKSGIILRGECGGKGICGRCKIKFLRDAPQPTEIEQRVFSRPDLEGGWRLACQHTVAQDVDILVPSESGVPQDKVRASSLSLPSRPLAVLERLEIPFSRLEENKADLEKLEATIGAPLDIPLFLLRKLPKTLQEGRCRVSLIRIGNQAVSISPGWKKTGLYGLAIDIGTTTLAAYLLDLETGKEIGARAAINPQVPFGADVLARITYVRNSNKRKEALKSLKEAVMNGLHCLINHLTTLNKIKRHDIAHSVVAGNPTMLHLFLGVDPSQIGESPFSLVWRRTLSFRAKDLGLKIHPEAVVHILPLVSGYLGADIVAGILACNMHTAERPCLLLDLGTNGEIVLAAKNHIWACSTAAGPAFEGGRISCGMPALEGAISHVAYVNAELSLQVIGDVAPKGLCGSGLVDLVAILCDVGLLGKTGRFEQGNHPLASRLSISQGRFLVTESIFVTQRDVREIQLGKAAIRAGVDVLLREAGIAAQDLDTVYLAGAFGSQIFPESLVTIGLLPQELLSKIQSLGNAAGMGAKKVLLDRNALHNAEEIANSTEYIDLSNSTEFKKRFIQHMGF